jgi:CBS domain-containing protein
MNVIGEISAILEHKGREIWSVAPETTVFDAIRLMASKNVGALLVLEREKLAGIISERDYTRKVILRGRSSRETEVREIMSKPVIFVRPEQSMEGCMRIMTEHRVRHLPVLEGERVVGIVSIGDLVKWIILAQSVTIDQLEGYIAGKYPG